MEFKMRAAVASLLMLLLAGALAAASANAEPGPFLYHRETGTENGVEEIAAAKPEVVQGEGGAQRLVGVVGAENIEIEAPSVQVKGVFYDTGTQGQAKLELKFHEPKVVKPELKGCEVSIGEDDTTKIAGHLAWKWNGEKKQLEESAQPSQTPDWIFLGSEIAEGATELPKSSLASVVLKGSGCGLLAGTFKVEGSETGWINPGGVKEWASSQVISTHEGKGKQHFWNGKAAVGVETGLTFAKGPASLIGQIKVKDPTQEVAIFEAVPAFRSTGNANFQIKVKSKGAQEFIFSGIVIECATQKGASLSVFEMSPTPSVTVRQTFETCNYKSGSTMIGVNNFSCQMVFRAAGTLDIGTVCDIEVTGASPCTITVEAITARGAVAYTTLATTPKTIEDVADTQDMRYGGTCGESGGNGKYKGTSTWTGYNEALSQVGIETVA